MDTKKINKYSDFSILYSFKDKDGSPLPIPYYPFDIVICGVGHYLCSFDGTRYINAHRYDEHTIKLIVARHKLGAARLMLTLKLHLPNTEFPEDVQYIVNPQLSDIELWDGASDAEDVNPEVSAELAAIIKGDPGKSAYQVWLDEGNTGTEADFLASLKGAPFTYADFTPAQLDALKGPKGDQGDTGATGPQGQKGDTGAAGPAGATGATGATGAQGTKGDTGAPFTYADFTPAQLAALQGPKGDKGDTGPQGATGNTGAAGAQGPKGDTGAPFTYADFTPAQLAALQGPKGDKGDTGPQGATGATGATGPQGQKGDTPQKGVDYPDFTGYEAKLLVLDYDDGTTETYNIYCKKQS